MGRRCVALALSLVALGSFAGETPWQVETIVGGGPAGPALDVFLPTPSRVVSSPSGHTYVIGGHGRQLIEIAPDGQVRAIATNAVSFGDLSDVAAVSDGKIWVALRGSVYRLDPLTGSVDATAAADRDSPIVVDNQDRPYMVFGLSSGDVVFRYDPAADGYTPVFGCLGSPCPLFSSDGASATSVSVGSLTSLAIDPSGDLFVSTRTRVFRIDAGMGTISVYAGSGEVGDAGDGGPATLAEFDQIRDMSFDAVGNLYIADSARIRRVDALTRILATLAGSTVEGYAGDGGPAALALLAAPGGVTVTPAGDVIVGDTINHRLRAVAASSGIIDTIAGNGLEQYDGREVPATHVSLAPENGVVDSQGILYFTDSRRILRFDPSTGLMRAFAGNGEQPSGPWVDGVDALDAVIGPGSLAIDSDDELYFLDSGFIHRIDRTTGQIFRLTLPGVSRFAMGGSGKIFVSGFQGPIQSYDVATDQLTPVAGTGTEDVIDGVDALDVELDFLNGFTIGPDDELFVSHGLSIWRLAGQTLLRYAGGLGGQPGQIDLGDGPVSPAVIPSSRSLEARFDAVGNGFTWAVFLDEIYRVDRYGQDAVRILGVPFDPFNPGPFEILPRWLQPSPQGAELYVGSTRRVLRATNTSQTPIALASTSGGVTCTGAEGASIQLDATASYDPDDVPGEPSEINLYRWFLDFGTPAESVLAKGALAEATLPVGDHDVTLLVRDFWGKTSTATVTVSVYPAGDPDADGIDACVDNCLSIANPGQQDADQNGVGDACDLCLGNASGDADGDGVCTDVDNCSMVENAAQSDTDLDGTGDECDVCPLARVDASDDAGMCLSVPDVGGDCVPVAVDSENPAASGQIVLEFYEERAPDRLTLLLTVASNSVADRYQVLVNGELIIDEASTTFPFGSCQLRSLSFESSSAPALAAAWNPGESNEIRFIKTGTETDVFSALVSLSRGSDSTGVQLHSVNAFTCTDELTDVELYSTGSVDDIFSFYSVRSSTYYEPGAPRMFFDSQELEAGQYALCVTSTDKHLPGKIYGITRLGNLLEIDWLGGEGKVVGTVPLVPDGFAFDILSGRAVINRGRLLQEIDLTDGTSRGGYLQLPGRVDATAFRDGVLIGASHVLSGLDPPAAFVSFYDASGGFGDLIFSLQNLDRAFIHDLSYDPVSDSLFGVSGLNHFGGSTTFRSDFGPEPETIYVGGGGESIAVGPDNVVYRALRTASAPAELYRLGANGYDPVGIVGSEEIVALTSTGTRGHRDCTTFHLEDGQSLAVNETCAEPTARIVAPADTECDSTLGGTVVLDGSGSINPNDPDDVLADDLTYAWYEDYGTNAQRLIGSAALVEASLAVGSHELTLEVTNRFGESAISAVTAVVQDTVAPQLDVRLSPSVLRPLNYRMHDVASTLTATDLCGDTTVELVSIESNHGLTDDDVEGADFGTDDRMFRLRAALLRKSERIYTVSYRATDPSGNTSLRESHVMVPTDPHLLSTSPNPIPLFFRLFSP